MGHLERFPPERLSGWCRIGQETSAGAYSDDGLAPLPAVHGIVTKCPLLDSSALTHYAPAVIFTVYLPVRN